MYKKYWILTGIILIWIFVYFTTSVSADLAIDGNVSGGGTLAFANANLTTTQANDVIIIFAANGNLTAINNVSAITDSAGLTWIKRAAHNITAATIEEWYAIAPFILTNDQINVSWNGSGSNTFVAYAISGADIITPFDVNSSAQGRNSTTSIALLNVNINTTAADTMIIGGIVGARTTTGGGANCREFTVGTGYTRILTNNSASNPCATIDTEYQIVSAAQLRKGVNETGDFSQTTAYIILADAVRKNPSPPQWSFNSTNSTTAGTAISHNILWTGDNNLSGYIFSFDNGTGTFTNDSFVTFTGIANWSNVTKIVNSTLNSTIKWKVYANDSANKWNATDIFNYTTTDIIFFDNFESGSLDTKNWRIYSTGSKNWTIGTAPYEGTFDTEVTTLNVNSNFLYLENNLSNSGTSGFSNINVSYYRNLNTGASFNFTVEWWDGTKWNILENINTDTAGYKYKEFILPSSANNNSNFKLRFSVSDTTFGDSCAVDYITVRGTFLKADTISPIINSVSSPNSVINGTNVLIKANITDNAAINSVWIDISGTNYTMTKESLIGAKTLFYEDFESGTLNTNDWNSTAVEKYWSVGSSDIYNGSYNAEVFYTKSINPPSYIEKTIDTSGYSNINFSYYRKLIGLDSVDNFTAEWFNGTDWNILESVYSNDVDYVFKNFLLPSDANNNPNLRIRFGCKTNAFTEGCRLENVNVSAQSSSVPDEMWEYTFPATSFGSFNYMIYANDTNGNSATGFLGNFSVIEANITINEAVQNATGDVQDTNMEIIDENNTSIYYQTGPVHQAKVPKGNYKIRINPVNNPIQQINIDNISINRDIGGIIDIDNPPSTKNFTRIYALNPLLNSTNATVTVLAVGDELYKCKDWNFTNQTCYGSWVKIRDIIPGDQYNFILTPEDPAFGEVPVTEAEHLDSNRNFISDIYEQVRVLDDVWSETIPENDYVRVTFKVPLDNKKDITLYPRVVGGSPTINVYEKDSNDTIATFDSITSNEYNKVLLTNLQNPQNTFDLKVIGGSVEFDYIVDPPWANTSFDKCKNITIKNGGATALTNFPVYVNLTYNTNMLANYDDLRFYSSFCNNGGNLLPYEIENYTSTNANIWVGIPTLSAGNNVISVYYHNNTAVTSGQNVTGVWINNYTAVYHFKEGSGNMVNDSTSNSKNGTLNETTKWVRGQIGSAYNFTGAYVNLTTLSTSSYTQISVEAWFKARTALAQYSTMVSRIDDDNWAAGWGLGAEVAANTMAFWVDLYTNEATMSFTDTTSYNYATGTFNTTTSNVYVNSTRGTPQAGVTWDSPGTKTPLIGCARNNAGPAYFFQGIIDEVRISNISRSSDWINQSYWLIKNQASFVTFGGEENYSAEDSCTYTSGNWNVECSDNCVIDSNVNGDGSNFTLNGTGNFYVNANITGFKRIVKDNNCYVIKLFPNYIQIG